MRFPNDGDSTAHKHLLSAVANGLSFCCFFFPLNHEHILLYQGCKQNNFELFRVSAGSVLHVTVFQHLLFDNYSSLSSQYLLIFCFSLSTRSPTVCCFFPPFLCSSLSTVPTFSICWQLCMDT